MKRDVMLRSSEASRASLVNGILRSEDCAQNDVFRAKFVKDTFSFLNHAEFWVYEVKPVLNRFLVSDVEFIRCRCQDFIMQTVARNNFITVKTEGGILPANLLQRIADGTVPGLNPTDYHLAAGDRLNEAINRSWLQLLGRWQTFRQKMENAVPGDTGTTLTRDWVLALLQELGYGRLPYQGSLIISHSSSVKDNDASLMTHDETSYPISHLYDHTPIHLIAFRQALDRRDESQAIKRSPHSLMQEFLNRSDDNLWGFVSNGLRFRILRDNVSLTRAAYVEFDLEAMFDGELYSDFSLFWLVAHQSRVEVRETGDRRLETDDQSPVSNLQSPANCWLEKWSQTAVEQGTRALDALRDGVQEAIAALGRGFLAHKGNGSLRQRLQNGDLTTGDYYRQLLRLVYRLLFLFVAEDRELLLLPDAPPAVARQYDQYYSVARLRRLAETRRGGPHPDLYRGLRLLSRNLRTGYAPLGLPGLGGFLFSERATPDLDGADIANQDLLDTIRALAFTTEGKVRRLIDYKNLGTEEFGSVYESLLELHPHLHVASATFALDVTAGSERKTTGSYYTDKSLIQSLLDSALEPVVADRLRRAEEQWREEEGVKGSGDQKSQGEGVTPSPLLPLTRSLEEALLSIKVVDLAAGSGHFLIGAARRLARHLARIRTGDEEPGPEAIRHALRDVVGQCIYGVDINEMAVELCKVALWMETLDPGRPLSFLDANIQCGNSLMGATPALLAQGIPDEAFTPIMGDDRTYCAEWKKQNKAQKQQGTLFSGDMRPWERLGDFAAAMRRMSRGGDATLADVQAREAEYVRLTQSSDYEYGKLWADAWCAAFVWTKRPEAQGGWPYPITEQVFRNLERSPHREPAWLKEEVRRLAEAYKFFHLHLAFPQVFTPRDDAGTDGNDVTGWDGGFDVVLGNPPWDKVEFVEKEWFATRNQDIAIARTAAKRKKEIEELRAEDPRLYSEYVNAVRFGAGERNFYRLSGRYPLCGRGRINTYAIFAELNRSISVGTVGAILPTGIATDDTTKFFFQDIISDRGLVSLYDFENRQGIFPNIQGNLRFCLITMSTRHQEEIEMAGQLADPSQLKEAIRVYKLNVDDIIKINPNTQTCPIFVSSRDANIITNVYRKLPVLIVHEQKKNIWNILYRVGLFNLTHDSNLFSTFSTGHF
jgi:hypothetical protein